MFNINRLSEDCLWVPIPTPPHPLEMFPRAIYTNRKWFLLTGTKAKYCVNKKQQLCKLHFGSNVLIDFHEFSRNLIKFSIREGKNV